MNPNCLERRDSTVAPQALHLMNNAMVRQLAEHFAQRVSREVGIDAAKRIERVYLVALSRFPNKHEMDIGLNALTKLTDHWLAASGKADRDAAQQKALASYCHAIINSAGFLYVD